MKQDPIQNSSKVAVTFEASASINAGAVWVVGEFNDWDPTVAPMKRRKDGMWAKTLRLAPGVYRFRYVTDAGDWYNDEEADSYEPSGLGEDNSVVVVRAG
jgi:1,4-alpha-glucan branching enzyme